MKVKLDFDEICDDIKRLMDGMMVMVKDLARSKGIDPDEFVAPLDQLRSNPDEPVLRYVADQLHAPGDSGSESKISVENPDYEALVVKKLMDSEGIGDWEINHSIVEETPSRSRADAIAETYVDDRSTEEVTTIKHVALGQHELEPPPIHELVEEDKQPLPWKLGSLKTTRHLFDRMPMPMPIDLFGVVRGMNMKSNPNNYNSILVKAELSFSDLYYHTENNLIYVAFGGYENNVSLFDDDAMFLFDPGGCTLSQMDCDPFEFIGEQRDFYSVTNVAEFIAFTDMIKDASNCDDLVQNHGTDEDIFEYEGFLRHGQASLVLVDCPDTIERTGTWQTNYGVSDCFVNYLCVTHTLKGGSAFLSNKGVLVPTSISTLGNSVLASFHNIGKTSGAIMILGLFKILEGVLVEWFLFIHPKDVRFTSLNISIGWEVACEEVERVFTWKSHFIFNLGVPLDDLSWKIVITIVVASLLIHVVSRILFTDRSLRNSRLKLVVSQLVEPIAFELGKSPIVVFEDDDTDNAIDWTIFNFFLTMGRIHCATFHLLIHVRIAKRFFGRFMIWCQDVGEYLTLEKLSKEMCAGIKKVGWISMIYEDELWGVDLYRVEKNNKMEETKLQECNHTALAKSTSQLQTGLPGSIYIHAASVFHQKPLAVFWTDYVSFRRCHTPILCGSLLSEYTLACLGDTCFSNAVILCLTYTEPLLLGLFYWRNHRFGRLRVRCALYESVEISLRFIVEVVTPQILRGGLSLSTLPCCKCDLFSQFSVKYELPIDFR